MKILHLIYDYINNPWVGGGGAVRVHEICRRLADRGHEVTVVCGKYPGAISAKTSGLDYRFIGSDSSYPASTFSYAIRAAGFVRKNADEFDIVVEDFAPWNPVFSNLFTRKPVVLHVNHREGIGIIKRWNVPGILFYLIEAVYPRLFRNITALSTETRRKINRSDAVIVPPGIDDSLLDAQARAGANPENSEEENDLMYVGRLHIKNKGLDTLLHAMRRINARLLLAGKGQDEEALKKLAEELALKNISFYGFVTEEEKIRLLRNTRLFVLPSRFEGWGIVVLEAAACGRAVIVSDIPELHYAVEAGFGVSFRAGDADDLAEKMNKLLADESLRKEMGRKAVEFAKRYTWDAITNEYERYLLKVLGAPKACKQINEDIDP